MSDDVQSSASSVDTNPIQQILAGYAEYARENRRAGSFRTAGDYYVAGARGELMLFRHVPDGIGDEDQSFPTPPTLAQFGYGMKGLLAGALSYRLGEQIRQSRNLSEQACLILSDLIENEFTERPKIGLCHEIKGDFMVVSDVDGYEDSYESAANYYEDADSDLGWQMEDAFDDFTLIVTELAESVDYEIEDEVAEQFRRLSLHARVEYKRENFPEIIDRVAEAGNWESDVF